SFSFCFITFADTIMLSSYNINIGALTVNSVMISAVGVIIAAMIKMITMAYRRLARMKWWVMMPMLDKIKISIGNRNIIQQPSVIVAIVDKEELMVIWFVISTLNDTFAKKLTESGTTM